MPIDHRVSGSQIHDMCQIKVGVLLICHIGGSCNSKSIKIVDVDKPHRLTSTQEQKVMLVYFEVKK